MRIILNDNFIILQSYIQSFRIKIDLTLFYANFLLLKGESIIAICLVNLLISHFKSHATFL